MINSIKKLALIVCVVLISSNVYAQVPQGFNFQAVARGTDGLPLINENLGVQISVVKGTEAGDVVYTETHSVTSNPVGLIQLVIGEGAAAENSDFSAIDWSSDNYFVKLEIDPNGGTTYEDLGTTRLLSVPYALLAQDVVNGGIGSSGASTDYVINTSAGDTSFSIVAEGDESILGALQVRSNTAGSNRGVDARISTSAENQSTQLAVYGRADGQGTGNHFGVYGIALGNENQGGNRYGLLGWGQGAGRYNFGVQAVAQGAGSGEIVAIGDELDGFFGSYNIGGGFYTSGNVNGNSGIDVSVDGDQGQRINIGGEFRVSTTATGQNSGVQTIVNGSSTLNRGFWGLVDGDNDNVGMELNVNGGTSNRGLIINADTAAIFNGDVVVNGNLTYAGLSGGSANGQTLDSLFISTQPESETQRRTTFYPGFIRNTDSNGDFSTFSRSTLQYGSGTGDGFVYNWYNRGNFQVARDDYRNGERASGMSGGYFYMDISEGDNFYVPLEIGIGNAAEGGKSFLGMSSLGMKKAGKGNLFTVSISNDPNGNDPTGESSEMFLWGDESPNFQIGGQPWNDSNLGFFSMYGTTSNGDGWYRNNFNLAVGSDGTEEWADMVFVKTNSVTDTFVAETIIIDGKNGNINLAGSLTQSSDIRLKKDIQTLDNALNKTLSLRGVSYTWKTDMNNENPQIGVIAQELEEVYPEFVRTDDEGMKSVNYAQMTAVLIEAVKELNEKIEALENENQTLQAQVKQIDTMKAELSKIWKALEQGSVSTVTKIPNE